MSRVKGLQMLNLGRAPKIEESMLAAQFGKAFEEHRQHTGFLIPK
jgi:protein-S-isoprenylcysteine O-methyltransferase Ste14